MDISHCVEWFNALPTTSPAMKVMGQPMATRAFDPLFPIDLVEKDFGYLNSLGKQSSSVVPLSEKTQDVYRQATEGSFGKANISGVIQLYTDG